MSARRLIRDLHVIEIRERVTLGIVAVRHDTDSNHRGHM